MHMLSKIYNEFHHFITGDNASSRGTSPYGRGPMFENQALLHLAIKENDIYAVKHFLHSKKWAQLQAPDKMGRTPLHWALAVGTSEVARLILKNANKSMINAYDKYWRTALHYAAMAGKNDIVKILFIKGARINAKDKQGMTPLHYAAQNSNPFLIHSLIARGARKHIKDKNKKMPHDVAVCWKSPPEIIHHLNPLTKTQLKKHLVNQAPYQYSYQDHYDCDMELKSSKSGHSPQGLKLQRLPMPFLGVSLDFLSATPRRQPLPTPKERSMEAIVKLELERETNQAKLMVMQNLNVGNSRFTHVKTQQEAQKHNMALSALLMRQRTRKEGEMTKRMAERQRLNNLDSQRYKSSSITQSKVSLDGNIVYGSTTPTKGRRKEQDMTKEMAERQKLSDLNSKQYKSGGITQSKVGLDGNIIYGSTTPMKGQRKEQNMTQKMAVMQKLSNLNSEWYKHGSKTLSKVGFPGNGQSRSTTPIPPPTKGKGSNIGVVEIEGGVLSLYEWWKSRGKSLKGLQQSTPFLRPTSRNIDAPPRSLHQGKSSDCFGLRDRRKIVVKKTYTYPFLRDPLRIPMPSRLALTEFKGTSDRQNHLNEKRAKALNIHQCVDKEKLRSQWL
ncbi:unnamed protein product [Calypogeia fissa]